MINECSLLDRKCTPCQGDVPSLDYQKVNDFLMQLQNKWQINSHGHLYKSYKFTNFKEAIEFANKITIVAEFDGHHPDLFISWGICTVEIWTHKINGLTENDFILATKIEVLLE